MSGGYNEIGTHEMDPMIERVLLLKQEAFVYKIPPNQIPEDESKGWEATKWNLNKPDWTGKLKVVSKGTNLTIKLEDRGSMKPFAIAQKIADKHLNTSQTNTDNNLGTVKPYAEVNVDTYPGPNVQTVKDSSRYFVVKPIEGPPIGLGFADRSDAFDMNMALNEHFKSLRVDDEIAKESEEPREQLDLSLKEGQTIKVNINIPRKSNRDRSKSPAPGSGVIPPPSAAAIAAGILPPSATPATSNPFAAAQAAPRLTGPPPARAANPSWIKF